MKHLVFVLFVITACTAAIAQSASSSDAIRSKLIAMENAWNQAQLHRDSKAINEMVADTFVYTDTDGTVMNKAKFMADIKNPSVVTTVVANRDVEVYLYSDVAIVTGEYRAKGKYKGEPFDHRGRFTDTWILASGRWQCVASHTNLMKSNAE